MICNRTDWFRDNFDGSSNESTQRYPVESIIDLVKAEVSKGRIIRDMYETEDMLIFRASSGSAGKGGLESGSTYLIEKKAWE